MQLTSTLFSPFWQYLLLISLTIVNHRIDMKEENVLLKRKKDYLANLELDCWNTVGLDNYCNVFFDILRMFLHFLWIYMDKIYSVKTILTYVFLEENLINLRFDWRTNNKYNNNNNKIVYYLHTLQYNMFKDYVRDKQNISTVVPYRVQYKLQKYTTCH